MKDAEILKECFAQLGRKIGTAISADAAAGHDSQGTKVDSLTEAVMGVTSALTQIAEAIESLADAVRAVKEV